jgi:hypothetical protein
MPLLYDMRIRRIALFDGSVAIHSQTNSPPTSIGVSSTINHKFSFFSYEISFDMFGAASNSKYGR